MVKDFKDIGTIYNSDGVYDLYLGHELASSIQFEMKDTERLLNELVIEKKK